MAPADSRDYVFWYGGTRFYSSARWAQSGIVVPFMRRLHVQAFGYYTNMGQQIHNSYKHSTPPCNFFYLMSRSRSKIKKKIC